MYLMIDNYDSFVYNLACYFEENGARIRLVRNDRITLEEIDACLEAGELEGIILSPGPKSPKDCGICTGIVQKFADRIPILGVCLGHQIIGDVFGAQVVKGIRPMHGKVTTIHSTREGVFFGLPEQFQVTRYHSLIVSDERLPQDLIVDARSEEGVIMGMHHRRYPVYGVQFHPEAVLTEYGHELLDNFMTLCSEWKEQHGSQGN